MKRLFALTIILGIIICAVCATSFSAERTIGHFTTESQTGNDMSYDRAVGDLPSEDPTEPTEETEAIETTIRETPTTDETIAEDETTTESTEVPTEAETVAETTVETTTAETETPATDDSVPPADPKNPHHAVKTGDNALLYVGIGMLGIALILLIVTGRKRTRSYEK